MKNFFVVFVIYFFVIDCSNSYEYKIEGSSGFDIQVNEKPYPGAVETEFKVNIPFTRDITQYEGEYFELKVKKLQQSGTLRLRVIKYNKN